MQRAVDARREIGAEVREVPALPRQVVVAEHDAAAVVGGDARDRARGVDVERERAEVVDDHEIGAVERGRDLGVVDRRRRVAGASMREPGQHDVVGPAAVFDRAGDAPHLEAELAERPRPLAGFDRDAVGAAEPERDDDSLRAPRSSTIGQRAATGARGRAVEASDG